MESATASPGMSFPKKPRKGQQSVIDESVGRLLLNVKLPTGYGKTLAFCFVYSLKKAVGIANRLLVIFPTDAQLEQFMRDGHKDLRDAGVEGPVKIIDIRFSGSAALKKHRANTSQVFVITIQSLINQRGMDNVTELLAVGQWMIVVDEYHHYGIEKTWGRNILGLNRAFLMVLSATPTRPGRDGAFGMPHVSVLYREAKEEKAVKSLIGHSYSYRIEALSEEGTVVLTTDELIKEAGGDSPEAIERFRIER